MAFPPLAWTPKLTECTTQILNSYNTAKLYPKAKEELLETLQSIATLEVHSCPKQLPPAPGLGSLPCALLLCSPSFSCSVAPSGALQRGCFLAASTCRLNSCSCKPCVCLNSYLDRYICGSNLYQQQAFPQFSPKRLVKNKSCCPSNLIPLTHTCVKINKGIWYWNSQIAHLLNLQRETFPWCVCAAKHQLGITPHALSTFPHNTWGAHYTLSSAQEHGLLPHYTRFSVWMTSMVLGCPSLPAGHLPWSQHLCSFGTTCTATLGNCLAPTSASP